MVRHTGLEPLYDSLVDQFHYLGYVQIVGNHLKYMAFSGDTPIACIGWGFKVSNPAMGKCQAPGIENFSLEHQENFKRLDQSV